MNPKISSFAWLRRLDWALHALPARDRDEIVREIRSHIEERMAQGQNEQHVLASLGTPEDYARGFLDAFELSQAVAARRVTRMISVATQHLHRNLRVALAFIGVCVLAMMAFGVALTALMHFFDPTHWGLWVSERMVLIGHVDDPQEARELLGAGIYPFAMITVTACWMSGRALLQHALHRLVVNSMLTEKK